MLKKYQSGKKKWKRFFPWKSKQMNHEFSVHPRLSRFNFLYSVKKKSLHLYGLSSTGSSDYPE